MTPILVLISGINPGTAVGTDLLFASLTKIVGSTVHGKRNTIDWPDHGPAGSWQRARRYCRAGLAVVGR
jgi:uncharacterized membrane protein YfcA